MDAFFAYIRNFLERPYLIFMNFIIYPVLNKVFILLRLVHSWTYTFHGYSL
jgi:hypothetical protein